MMPEIDAYGWGSDSVLHSRLGKSMHRLLLEKNLLTTARATVGADMAPSLVGHSL